MKKQKPLTKKQEDIIIRVAQGKSNDEIATELGMKTSNVVSHLGRVYTKLGIFGSTWDKRIKLIRLFWKDGK